MALIAIFLVPMTAPTASAAPALTGVVSIDAGPVTDASSPAEEPRDAAIRTSVALAGIVVVTVIGVWLWWLLMIRARR